jgi:hypothetical protein
MTMTAREDVETLLNELMPFVESQLSTEGMLPPFGAIVTIEDKKEIVRAAPEESENVGLVDALTAALKTRVGEGDIRIVAIILDVTATLPGEESETDAVQFRFEHKDHYAAEVFIPYTAGEEGLVFGKLFGQTGDAVFFPE